MTDPTGTQASHPMLAVAPPRRDDQPAPDATHTEAGHPMTAALAPSRGTDSG